MFFADYVFYDGEVITVDRFDSVVDCVCVKGRKILATGEYNSLQHLIGPNTKRIRLNGRSLLPGFNDAHLHLVLYGVNQLAINCKESGMDSLEAIIHALSEKAKSTPPGRWIRAWGFNERKVTEQRYPTLEELDAISTEHPIIITRTCGHISVVNSKALKLANIDQHTPNPQGGIIEKDQNGHFTGRLIEAANMEMNQVASYTEEELLKAIEIANRDFLAAGITSVGEAGAFNADSFRALQIASQQGLLQLRIYALLGSLVDSKDFLKKIIASGTLTGTGNEWFKLGPVKLFLDGSSTGPTIATREGYTSDPANHGILYYSEEEIYNILGHAHKLGYQITVHAQGDKAIEMYLNVVERALKEHPRKDHRHRIEHAGISTPDLQKRIKELGLIPVPNPPFHYEFGESYIHNYGERVRYMYPARDFIDQGILAAAGSDSPVTDYNPLVGIHTAVNRKTSEGTPIGENQSINVLEAIRMYTYNGAYASFEEHIKGSIEPGKLADLVVLNDSILNIHPHHIKDLQVDLTMIDGNILYQRKDSKEVGFYEVH
ncbi:amidohydrolase [Ureibacillus thermosphaericus]|uniref:amidohydrolase n=1 Tax=Ureibacillus thermosphaericus TaxID=51173 RepID=UPI000BBC3344|nr:amidohydrolase [Ureibacillus thermosphaericus]